MDGKYIWLIKIRAERFVCLRNVNLPIFIWLYSTEITFCFYILKTKSIAFMNENKSLMIGLYRGSMTDFVRGHGG